MNNDEVRGPVSERVNGTSPLGRIASAGLRLIVLGLAVHLLLPQITSISHSSHVLYSLTWWVVLLALASQALSYTGNGYVSQQLVRLFGHTVSLYRCLQIVLASYSMGLIWGGQVTYSGATVRWLRGKNKAR